MAQHRRAPAHAPVWRQVVVRTRDLDTETTRVRVYERCVPADRQRQRLQLIDVVGELHPGARIKSFADGVASFLLRANLIVARYGDVVEPPAGEAPAAESDNLRLFEDVA